MVWLIDWLVGREYWRHASTFYIVSGHDGDMTHSIVDRVLDHLLDSDSSRETVGIRSKSPG